MRNPLHYSAELLVKRAAPTLNIPAYAPLASGPAMSDEQIAAMLQNIQSYPEAQQQQILDTINQEYGNSGYRGGLVGSALGNIGNYLGSAFNTLQQGANWASQGLFGKKPFDAQDSDRYRAETVLRTAATNPEMFKRLTESIQKTLPAAQSSAPAATTPAAPAAQATAPAVKPEPKAQASAAPAAKPIPTAKEEAKPTVVSAPKKKPSAKPTAAPKRKEGLIEGIPASQWIAQNKARQADEAAGRVKASPVKPVVNTNPNAGLRYNPTTGQYHPPGYNMYAGKVI
jgi:hypothetical protein